MSRQSERLIAHLRITVVLVMALAQFGGPTRADDLALYLERAGLNDLLAVHLEQQLGRATGEDREEILLRLAQIYSALIDRAEDPIRRRELEERTRALAEQARTGELPIDLELALLRSRYRGAEEVAERHRVRSAVPEDVERAKQTLAEITPLFRELSARAARAESSAQKELQRREGTEALEGSEAYRQAAASARQSSYLTAWSLHYSVLLGAGGREEALDAQERFDRILDLRPGDSADRVSIDRRGEEAFARSILGGALCRLQTATPDEAEEWLDLLAHERSFGPLREQLTAWRLYVLVAGGRPAAARRVLEELERTGVTVPVPWLRLVTAYALEAGVRDSRASELAQFCLGRLAARGAFEEVHDLANRYGIEALGAKGFVVRAVRGVLAFRAAQQLGESQDTLGDASSAKFDEARTELEGALRETDADQHGAMLGECIRLIGLCHYHTGDLDAARARFLEAYERLQAPQNAEALYLA